MGKLFGTDGIRGEANRYPMDAPMALKVGQALAFLKRRTGKRPRILIGRDTRISGSMLESALSAGVASAGGTPISVGVLPTPGIAFMARHTQADAGVVISASHNPFQDNGIKIFSGKGVKLSDEAEENLEGLLLKDRLGEVICRPREIGRAETIDDAAEQYIRFLKATFPPGISMEGIRVVLDTANGATFRVAPEIFQALGAQVEAIHDRPDGFNINESCGSQHIRDLQEKVLQSGAAIGIAFDGDGDRLIAVDEKGRKVTGDQTLLICARLLKQMGRLKNDLLVSTVMSNLGLIIACRKYGFRHHASNVGDRHVLETMTRLGAVVGGEESGHTILLDHHTTGDGILASLQVIAMMIRSGSPLSELAGIMDLFPQKLINVRVKSKPALQGVSQIMEAIRKAELALGDQGRVLVRYSGTENLCRVMVEGPTAELTERFCRQIAEAVEAALA
jgi:phosphoglucosamine mutase